MNAQKMKNNNTNRKENDDDILTPAPSYTHNKILIFVIKEIKKKEKKSP